MPIFPWVSEDQYKENRASAHWREHVFPTAEHLYTFYKAVYAGRQDIAGEVLSMPDPRDAKKAASVVFHTPKSGRKGAAERAWDASIARVVMTGVLYQKFAQNRELRERLAATGEAELLEMTNTAWGCGLTMAEVKRGVFAKKENRLGNALEWIRAYFRYGCAPESRYLYIGDSMVSRVRIPGPTAVPLPGKGAWEVATLLPCLAAPWCRNILVFAGTNDIAPQRQTSFLPPDFGAKPAMASPDQAAALSARRLMQAVRLVLDGNPATRIAIMEVLPRPNDVWCGDCLTGRRKGLCLHRAGPREYNANLAEQVQGLPDSSRVTVVRHPPLNDQAHFSHGSKVGLHPNKNGAALIAQNIERLFFGEVNPLRRHLLKLPAPTQDLC